MKTVVTGGAGFIGSHLVKRLIEQGREVVVVSDLAHLGIENLTDLGLRTSDLGLRTSDLGLRTSDMEVRKADLSDYHQALKSIEGADSVFHLAARVGNLEYLHATGMAELAALQTNLMIDANVFRACLENGVKKIVYASSCAVYPMDKQYSPGAVFSEDDLQLSQNQPWTSDIGHRTINPDGGYGWAKLMGEIELGWMKNIDIGIARIFNIYGENEPLGERGHVITDLISKAILYPNEEFIVRGDGKQSRDFLYVSDCVGALLKLEAALSRHRTSDIGHRTLTVNIGSGEAVSISTIAKKAVELSGKDIKIAYDPAQPVGPLSRTGDITRARALLNWQPKVSLDEGLRRTYEWVEKRLKEEGIAGQVFR